MSLIDIGANLTHRSYEKDLSDVLDRAKAANVSHIIVTGSDLESSIESVQLSKQSPNFLSATAGIHPHNAKDCKNQHWEEISKLCSTREVVAVGECGLDYNRNFSPREIQRAIFRKHLELASEIKKPLFLHQRDAHQDFYNLLKEYNSTDLSGVVHCFTDSEKALRDYIDLGLFIGITGWICDAKRGEELRRIVSFIPKDLLLIETDAPYLLPKNINPKPKSNRNEPSHLDAVVSMISECSNRSKNEITQQTRLNATKLFALPALLSVS
jgi:TatD DNase family protein